MICELPSVWCFVMATWVDYDLVSSADYGKHEIPFPLPCAWCRCFNLRTRISHFPCGCDKKWLKESRFVLAHSLRLQATPAGRNGGRSLRTLALHRPSGSNDWKGRCSTPFLFMIYSRIPSHGMKPPASKER